MNERPRAIPGLDVLKIVAITLIVFHHYQQVFDCNLGSLAFYGGEFYFGRLVELFFMVSGFLTLHTHEFGQSGGGCLYARRFVRKALRIFPIVTIALLYAVAIKLLRGELPLESWSLKAAFANALLMFRGWPGLSMIGVNNPTWYLCILLQCYVLFYLMLLTCERFGKSAHWRDTVPFGAIALIAIAFGLRFLHVVQTDAFRGYASFFLGVLLCDAVAWIEVRLDEGCSGIIGVVCAVGSVALVALSVVISSLQWVILLLGAWPLLVVAACLLSRYLDEWSDGLRKAGAVGFEVFVWHAPLMSTEKLVLMLTGFTVTRSYLTMVLFTALCWGVGWLIYEWVEVPIGRWISGSIAAKHVGAPE